MTKAWCIVGMPGSGKSHLAYSMALPNALVIDDIKTVDDLPENNVYEHIIITDPYFCLSLARHYADELLNLKYGDLEWIFFENNKEKCLANVIHRDDDRKVAGLIRFLNETYDIPADYTPREIWQNGE